MATAGTPFLELVRKSGLLDAATVDDFVTRLGPDAPADPARLAETFVRDGLLTPFQANTLLKGKYKGFVLRGKYKLLDLLGAGGMGQVYLCEHVLLRRLVAVKVLPPDKVNDRGVVERFFREARAVAALDHPNIVRVHDVEQDDKLPLMVMEFVDGSNLDVVLRKRGRLPPDRAAHYVAQAALGLQHAHEAGLVHRDIKPGNLLLDRTGTVRILDLGLARFFHDTKDQLTANFDDKSVLGTADYLAPEQAMSSTQVDARADVYSLGATFYALVVGEPPFADGTVPQKLVWHQLKDPVPVRERRPEVPVEMARVIERMMAKDPKDRYQTPLEVAEALAPWASRPLAPPPTDEMPVVRAAGANGPPAAGASTGAYLAQARMQQAMTGRYTPPGSAIARLAGRGRWPSVFAGGVVLVALAAGGVAAWRAMSPGASPAVAPPPAGEPPAAETSAEVAGVVRPEAARDHVGRVCTVEFEVKATGTSKTGLLFLNSDTNYRDKKTFTAVINPDLGERLGLRGKDDLERAYKGKTVRVRGEVTVYNSSAQIVIEDARQLQAVR